MPALVANDRPSRLTHVVVKAIRLLSSFMVLPSPSAPTWKVARPSGSSTGRTRATASSSPPIMNTSIRRSAPMAPPVSGASTRWWPEAARRSPSSRTTAGLLVERSTRMEPGAAAPAHAVGHGGDDVGRRQRQQRDVGLASHRRRRRRPPWHRSPPARRRGRRRAPRPRCRRPRGSPRWRPPMLPSPITPIGHRPSSLSSKCPGSALSARRTRAYSGSLTRVSGTRGGRKSWGCATTSSATATCT